MYFYRYCLPSECNASGSLFGLSWWGRCQMQVYAACPWCIFSLRLLYFLLFMFAFVFGCVCVAFGGCVAFVSFACCLYGGGRCALPNPVPSTTRFLLTPAVDVDGAMPTPQPLSTGDVNVWCVSKGLVYRTPTWLSIAANCEPQGCWRK